MIFFKFFKKDPFFCKSESGKWIGNSFRGDNLIWLTDKPLDSIAPNLNECVKFLKNLVEELNETCDFQSKKITVYLFENNIYKCVFFFFQIYLFVFLFKCI